MTSFGVRREDCPPPDGWYALEVARSIGGAVMGFLDSAHQALESAGADRPQLPSDRWFALVTRTFERVRAAKQEADGRQELLGLSVLNNTAMFFTVELSDLHEAIERSQATPSILDWATTIAEQIEYVADKFLDAVEERDVTLLLLLGNKLSAVGLDRTALEPHMLCSGSKVLSTMLATAPAGEKPGEHQSSVFLIDCNPLALSAKSDFLDLDDESSEVWRLKEAEVLSSDGSFSTRVVLDGNMRFDALHEALSEASTGIQCDLEKAVARTLAERPPGRVIVVTDGLSVLGGSDLSEFGGDPELVASYLCAEVPELKNWDAGFFLLGGRDCAELPFSACSISVDPVDELRPNFQSPC